MTSRRNLLVALGAGVISIPFASLAQQPPKIRRIGFLGARSRSTASNPDVYYDAFVQGMRELGYVEGTNLAVEWRFADGKYERLPILAVELVRLNVEAIVTHGTPSTQAVQRATNAIPIVTPAMGDPVAGGFAASLARPGGNITGLSLMAVDLSQKHLELLKLIVPKMARAAILVNPGNASHPATLRNLQSAAKPLGVRVMPVNAGSPEEIDRSFSAMRRERIDAVIVRNDTFFIGQRRQIVELAARTRLPTMFSYREDVDAGGLMSYGQNLADHYRRAATYVDKILKGAKPGELPIEQPTKIHLAINRKTAKALGLSIPQELLIRADEVFE